MGTRNDYRVSKIIVLCKDCGNDVGLYPARHKCSNDTKPFLPILCSTTTDQHWSEEDVPDLVSSNTPTSVKRQASDSSIESGKWSFFRTNSSSPVNKKQEKQDTSYFDSYTNKLESSSSFNNLNESSGKKLWGKMKENEKWKELIADSNKKKETTTSGKLWARIIHATVSNNTIEYHDNCAESDDEDWEGETHVSRILREYYQSKHQPLPSWLYEEEQDTLQCNKTTRSRKLWQKDTSLTAGSAREKERQLLRSNTNTYIKPNLMSRTQSERIMPLYKYNDDSNQTHNEDDFVYGSISPRRTNTTKRTPVKSYLDHVPMTRSATISQKQQNYF